MIPAVAEVELGSLINAEAAGTAVRALPVRSEIIPVSSSATASIRARCPGSKVAKTREVRPRPVMIADAGVIFLGMCLSKISPRHPVPARLERFTKPHSGWREASDSAHCIDDGVVTDAIIHYPALTSF